MSLKVDNGDEVPGKVMVDRLVYTDANKAIEDTLKYRVCNTNQYSDRPQCKPHGSQGGVNLWCAVAIT